VQHVTVKFYVREDGLGIHNPLLPGTESWRI